MTLEGRCYCGAVRYRTEGDPILKVQCHCRECQYVSGGAPNFTMAMPEAGFTWVQGAPKQFRRSDLPNPVTREFCGECGTQLVTRAPALPGAVLLKVGTLDDPAVFEAPQMAIFTAEKQPFHHVADGLMVFERAPSR
jgi:hypothetical protein